MDKPVPKTKEELITMLKEQLDKVEVPFHPSRTKSAKCKLLSKSSEKSERNSRKSYRRKSRKCNS